MSNIYRYYQIKKYFLFILINIIITFLSSIVKSEEIGLYGITLNDNLYQVLDKAFDKGFNITVLSNDLDKEYISRLEQNIPPDASIEDIINIIEDNKIIDSKILTMFPTDAIIKDIDKINDSNIIYNRNSLYFNINYGEFLNYKNEYKLNLIPIILENDKLTMSILFYKIDNQNEFMPLFIKIWPNGPSMNDAIIDLINKRYSSWKKQSKYLLINNGYCIYDYHGILFYNIDTLNKVNNIYEKIYKDINDKIKIRNNQDKENKLKNLQQGM